MAVTLDGGKTTISAQINVFSHHIQFSNMEPLFKRALLEYCVRFVDYDKTFIPGRGYVNTPKRVFAASTEDRQQLRFHLHVYSEVMEFLKLRGFKEDKMHIVQMPMTTGKPVAYKVLPKFVPYEYQIPIISYMSAIGHSKVITLQTGKGKAQRLSAAIKVPGGWSTMGKMEVGTDIIAADGTTTKVTGVFPQGKKQLYKITFADGRSTEACAEHLWRVYYINTQPHKRWRTVNTLEMLRLISMPNPRVYVPLLESEQNVDEQLPIAPYTLGALLGDGSLSSTSISISSGDPELFDNINK